MTYVLGALAMALAIAAMAATPLHVAAHVLTTYLGA